MKTAMRYKLIGKPCFRVAWMQLLLMLLFSPLAFAYDDQYQSQNEPQNQAQNQTDQPEFSQQELDQMLAPIALYPDALLSQVLIASTYPLEVVQAARWSRSHPELRGDAAVRAVEQNNWDPSVISLTAFPQVLAEMDAKLDWTERLGDAFLAQQEQVSDTVQNLRQRASEAGNLQSNDQIRVEPQGQTIVIEQAAPQVIYVPYYNPTVVYGPWWWDAYPPVYWDPWPGYYHPSYGSAFYWGSGISIGGGFFYSNFDWHRRHVNIVNQNNYYYNNRYHDHRFHDHDGRNAWVGNDDNHQWHHDPDHRRGVAYSAPALQQQFGRNNVNARPRPDRQNRDTVGRSISGQPLSGAENSLGARAAAAERNRRLAPVDAQPQNSVQTQRSLGARVDQRVQPTVQQNGRPIIQSGNVRQLDNDPAARATIRGYVRPDASDGESLGDRAANADRANRLNNGRMEMRSPVPSSSAGSSRVVAAPPTANAAPSSAPVGRPIESRGAAPQATMAGPRGNGNNEQNSLGNRARQAESRREGGPRQDNQN